MGKELRRLKKRKNIFQKMDMISDQSNTSLIIHYSCESFYDKTDGKTPRITSIAVRNLASGQTGSFSIHQIAEEKHIEFSEIDGNYNDLEKEMIQRFYSFVIVRQHYNWIHWNMRDVNYGFAAIEHRFRILGGTPTAIAEDKKFDLARALVDIYGVGYIGHPRLESIVKKNDITDKDFLVGAEEAKAFANKEFIKLHQSTLRKVDTLANLFERTANKSLKTNATWFEQYGLTPKAVFEWIKEHWIFTVLTVVSIILVIIIRVFELYKIVAGNP